jgi:outer membrane protein
VRRLLLLGCVLGYFSNAYAVDLLTIYQDATKNDPVYRQALNQQLSNAQGVPINLASLLPNAGIAATPYVAKTIASGSAVGFTSLPDGTSTTGSSSSRGYSAALTINQPLIDFAKINKYLMAKETAKQAQALINSAGQDLMIRVARAYFSVVADEENLRAAAVIKSAYAEQFKQVHSQYKNGLKSIIEVHTARASYEKSKAKYMALEIMLTIDKEKLHTITNRYYSSYAILNKRFPLLSPRPNNVEQWVATAERQNWDIKAAQYAKCSALANIKQQWAGHLPTLYLQGGYNVSFNRNMGDAASPSTGSSKFNTSSANLTLNVPVFQGGGVIAQTEKAKYDYEVSAGKLDKQYLDTIDLAKESFYGVVARVGKIKTDAMLITATEKSLAGMQESYKLGTENLINVLNQRESLFEAQQEYTTDRYLYLINLLSLKQAAGILSTNDLIMVNNWLVS